MTCSKYRDVLHYLFLALKVFERKQCDFKTTTMFIYLEPALRYKLYEGYGLFSVIKRLWARSNYRKSFHSLMLK